LKAEAASKTRLLVVPLSFAWGFNWIATALALRDVAPWSMRFAGAGIGMALLRFRSFLAFAQLSGATFRVIIITYSMPIWTTLLSVLFLGERVTAIRALAFALCVSGLAILIWPLFAGGLPASLFYALGCALSWTLATFYLKWVKATVPPLANAAWQLLFGFLFIGVGTFAFEGYPRLWPLPSESIFAVLYVGVIGVGLAHFLWWSIVARLPAITASIGALLVPVIGVTASTLFLHEHPTVTDVGGFLLIFAAAACVLLQPNVQHTEMPE